MINLNRELTAAYSSHEPIVQFDVVGGGSETGIAALMAGETDIAAASRKMTEAELTAFEQRTGSRPREVVIALDGLGIYVHNNNPVSTLTVPQIAQILSGEIRNWKEVGGLDRRIDVFTRDRNSGTRKYMETHVLRDRPFSSAARVVATTSLLTAAVSRNQGAIGYGGIAYIQGTDILRLSDRPGEVGLWPSRENVASGEYPLSRPLHYYINPASMDETLHEFVDWVLSPAGQRVVTFVGYYPAPQQAEASESLAGSRSSAAAEEPVMLTPESMARYGFELSLSFDQSSESGRDGRSSIVLRFERGSRLVEDSDLLSVCIGEDAEIPLSLDDDQTARFELRDALVEETVLRLEKQAASGDQIDYEIPLTAFVSRDARGR
jgi:phosphate transport system substrate-binding protein